MAEQGSKEKGGRGAPADFFKFIFIFSTLIAFRQEPRPDAYTEPEFPSADWWKYPIEKNAFARLPVVSYGALNDVFALPNSEKVWVAGDGGLIAHSDDGGKSWGRQYPPIEEVREVLPQPDQVSRKFSFDFVKNAYANGKSNVDQKKGTDVDLNKQKEIKTREAKKSPDTNKVSEPVSKDLEGFTVDKWQVFLVKMGYTAVKKTGVFDFATKDATKKYQLTKKLNADGKVGPKTFNQAKNDGYNNLTNNIKTNIFTGSFNSIFFTDENNGWAVGDKGTILHNTDGGEELEQTGKQNN